MPVLTSTLKPSPSPSPKPKHRRYAYVYAQCGHTFPDRSLAADIVHAGLCGPCWRDAEARKRAMRPAFLPAKRETFRTITFADVALAPATLALMRQGIPAKRQLAVRHTTEARTFDDQDYRTIVRKVLEQNADGAVLTLNPDESARLVKQRLRRVATVYGCQVCYHPAEAGNVIFTLRKEGV